MEYKYLIDESRNALVYTAPDLENFLKKALDCERIDAVDIKTTRIILNKKIYYVYKQYIYLEEKITIYVLCEA